MNVTIPLPTSGFTTMRSINYVHLLTYLLTFAMGVPEVDTDPVIRYCDSKVAVC